MAWGIRGTSHFQMEVRPSHEEINPPREYLEERGLIHGDQMLKYSDEIEDLFWPKSGHLLTGRKTVPHFSLFHYFPAISGDVRDCIEKFEPDLHTFKQVKIFRKDGTPFPREHFAVHIKNFLTDFICDRETNARSKAYGNKTVYYSSFTNDNQPNENKIVFIKLEIEGYNFWSSDRINGYNFFVSDELYELLRSRRLLSWTNCLYFEEV